MANIIPITAGDLFSVYGTVGYIDYSFRRRLKLDAPIDPDILAAALEKTAHDIPYTVARVGANDIAAVPGPEALG